MAPLQSVGGTWGIGGLKIPDFGLTELISSASGKTTNPTYNNPAVYQQTGGVPSAQNVSTVPWVQPGNTYVAPPVQQQQQQQTQSNPQAYMTAADNNARRNGANVGDIRDGMRWDGNSWSPAGGGGGGNTDQYRQQQEGQINSQFNEYFSNLDRQIGLLPGEQALQEGKIGNMATESQGQINLGNQQTQQTIDTGVTNAQANKATSLRDLEGNMRSALFAGNQYLGAKGASDSSAKDMYSFALSKQANKAKSGVLQTFNKTLGELDQKKVDLQNVTNQELTKLKTWKDNALIDVTNYISQKKDALMNMVSQGKIDQATALRELNTNIYNQAQQRLQAIDTQATQFAQSMNMWATQRAAALDDYKLQLTKSANFSVPDVINSEMMAYAPQAQASSAGGQLYGSYGGQKKDQWGNVIG